MRSAGESVMDSMNVMDCVTEAEISRDLNRRHKWDKSLQPLNVTEVQEALILLHKRGKVERVGDEWRIVREPIRKPAGQATLF